MVAENVLYVTDPCRKIIGYPLVASVVTQLDRRKFITLNAHLCLQHVNDKLIMHGVACKCRAVVL